MLLELAYNSKEKVLSLTGKAIKGESPQKMSQTSTFGRMGSKAELVEELKK